MKKLVKMKLINWHLFSNETITISNNCLITGENGTGKSTLLDAMQYVLTAGKAKFNSAANDSGKRDLIGYVRGKVGYENAPYLRTGDVISYIALEYYDEKTKESQVIGWCMELLSSNTKKELFFQILKTQISDDLFIIGNDIKNQQKFKQDLKNKNAHFENKKSSASVLFRQSLGVTSKYFDLIPRALAFKPINRVDQFIYDFLLMEDPVKIDDLKESIHAYRHLSDTLKQQEERLVLLEKISTSYDHYVKKEQTLNDYRLSKDVLNVDCINHEYERNTKLCAKNQIEHKHLIDQCDSFNKVIVELQKEELQIENSLENYEVYKLKKELELKLSHENERFDQIKKDYQHYLDLLRVEVSVLKKLRIKEQVVVKIANQEYDTAFLTDFLIDWKDEIKKRRDELINEKANLTLEYTQLEAKEMELSQQYDSICKNMFFYSNEVSNLIKLLRFELEKLHGHRVEVRPLCEYIEVTDEVWRNALEGFLNTQRFDIIVDPMYFKDALYLYEHYKKENNLYGVGLVNVAYLGKYDQAQEGSLACKIKTVNTYAKRYANMILNKIQCVDNVSELTNHSSAITSTCMTYRNFVVRAINPKIYERPYLGQGALKIQKQKLEYELKDVKDKLKKINLRLNSINNTISILNQSHSEVLLSTAGVVDSFMHLKASLYELKERILSISQDESIIGLSLQLQNIQDKLNKKRIEYDTIFTMKAKLENDISNLQKQICSLEKQKAETVLDESLLNSNVLKIREHYLKKYRNNFEIIFKFIDNRISEYKASSLKMINEVIFNMKDFNSITKQGYSESLDNIDDYLRLYYSLRDIEIAKRQEDVRRARMKCEMSFQESFISRLNEKIMNAKKDIQNLNKGLNDKCFNGDKYAFEVNPSKEQKKYYDIIISNKQYVSDDLFVETLDEKNRVIMDDLFNQIALLDESEKSESLLQKYTDYRKYLDYDILISHENGQTTRFSKVNKEKSGGETQNPFYIVIASSFEQLIKSRSNEDSGCVVLFDEAFNNMDETRIQAMMKFYSELNVQIIMVVPPERAAAITPYVDTTLITIKDGDCSFVEGFIHDSN